MAMPIYADTYHDLPTTSVMMPNASVVYKMLPSTGHVALTFDDGPDDMITPQILDVLFKKNVKATFFVVGHMVTKYPYMVERIYRQGHDLANHTWAHYRLDELSQNQIEQQVDSVRSLFNFLHIPLVPYMRPPGGRYNNMVLNTLKKQGLTMVMWDVNAADYKRENGKFPRPESIVKRVVKQIRPGSIVLMHNSPATVKALPQIIDQIRSQGLTIGKLRWTPSPI
jgi:peptidoglycan-N-acetylglucosamine deacetylase